jgi:PAS domain S-box-containing protein
MPWSRLQPWGVAVLSVVGALLVRVLVDPALGARQPFATFYVAVAVAAWFGGPRAGLLAMLLGYLAGDRLFLSRGRGLAILDPGAGDVVGAAVFAAVGLCIIVVIDAMHAAEARARDRQRQLEQAVGEQARARAAAEAAIRELDDFFEDSTIGCHWVGPDGTVLRANRTELDMLGYARDEYVGRNIVDFHVDRALIEDVLRRLARGETPCDQRARMHCRDGSVKTVLMHANARFDDGRFVHTRCFTRDITDRLEAEAAGRRSEARLEAIIGSATDAVITIDAQQRVTLFNAAAEEMFGCPADAALGQPLDRFLPERFRAAHRGHIRAFGETGITRRQMGGERVLTGLRADGREFPMEARISQTEVEGEKLYTVIIRDVRQRRQAEAEREELLTRERAARAEAEAANRAKDTFLATISHELRTPLSPILAWARMLRQGKLDPRKTARALDVIERCAQAQAQLVEDMLDVSRIMSGKLRMAVRPVALAPVVESAVDVVRPAAQAKQLRLQVELDAEAGMVRGDAERLQQVVWNLVSNAVKFTPRNGRVRVALARVDGQVAITVADTGQGIRPEVLPIVFEPFRQGDSSTTRVHGGLGLGLAIVRHIVEAHGGSVQAESAGEGRGAVFTVTLPPISDERADDAERAPDEPAAADAVPPLEGLRVLVVDDEPQSNEVVATLLTSCGAEVQVAASAAQAREVLARWQADVLVSDIGMPEEDGYALISRLRAGDADTARLPAVALTAYATRDDRVRLLSAGFQAHVPKPVDPGELVTVVANVARTARPLSA